MDGTTAARRWAVLAAALLLSGWLSTLGPGVGTPSSNAVSGGSSGSSGTAGKAGSGGARRVRSGGPAGGAQSAAVRSETRPPPQIDCRWRKCIALTFDDGPMRGTSKLLEVLATHRARATFFVVGENVDAYPGLVRQEAQAGHEIANHSYTHADLRRSSVPRIRSEIGRTQLAIRRITGRTPTLFRPPYGSTDRRVAAAARQNGLAQIIWSVDTADWRNRDARIVERRVVRGARRGGIVLMHDIHPTTIAAVPAILRRLAAQGYTFVTVTELFTSKAPVPGRKYIGPIVASAGTNGREGS